MWARKSYHACAAEMEQISDRFRAAFLANGRMDEYQRQKILVDTSIQGIEVLRVLAGAIRPEQDAGMIHRESMPVGALKKEAGEGEIADLIANYRPPFTRLDGFGPLGLREALNKVIHANPNPRSNGFFADASDHDLILSGPGPGGGKTWACVISLGALCMAVRSLPDTGIG